MIDRPIPLPTRGDAWRMLNEWVKSPSLIRHSLAVEAVLRKYAFEYRQDPLKWAITGLMHDFDYERHPEKGPNGHPFVGALVLEELQWPAEMREAILAHEAYTRVPRASLLAKVLFTVDELTGLICAHGMMRPDQSLDAVTVGDIIARIEDPGYHRALDRENLRLGLEVLHVPLKDHVALCLRALKPVQHRIGLRRTGSFLE